MRVNKVNPLPTTDMRNKDFCKIMGCWVAYHDYAQKLLANFDGCLIMVNN